MVDKRYVKIRITYNYICKICPKPEGIEEAFKVPKEYLRDSFSMTFSQKNHGRLPGQMNMAALRLLLNAKA